MRVKSMRQADTFGSVRGLLYGPLLECRRESADKPLAEERLFAAVFVYHEVKLMAGDVKGSKTLSFLTAPIAAVITKLDSLKSAITGGNLGAISTVDGSLGSIESQAGAKGVVIKEIVHSVS